jgi:hypothetical protein
LYIYKKNDLTLKLRKRHKTSMLNLESAEPSRIDER